MFDPVRIGPPLCATYSPSVAHRGRPTLFMIALLDPAAQWTGLGGRAMTRRTLFITRTASVLGAVTATLPVARSAQHRPVVVKIGLVEVGQRHKSVKVVNGHLALLKGDQTIFAQFAQHAVDVNRAQSKGIGYQVL